MRCINRVFTVIVLITVPLTVIGSLMHWSSILIFFICSAAVVALAGFMSRATESLATVAGSLIGKLLNATFGNAVEFIILVFALHAGLINDVLASLAGAVLGNLHLMAGLSFVLGGLKFKRQLYNIYDAWHYYELLIFAVIVAFVIPESKTLSFSIDMSVILNVLF